MLARLQATLARWYEVVPPCDIDEFVITRRAVAEAIAPACGARTGRERLLVAEQSGELAVSLFLDAEVLERLDRLPAGSPPGADQLDALWQVVEGVSHFLYLTWRANHRRPVSQLELELQAEIDKFLYTRQWLMDNRHTDHAGALHALLFERTRLHEDMDRAETERYATANRYAAKYCRALQSSPGRAQVPAHLNDLRRFYRLSQYQKLRLIDALQ